MRVKCRPLSHIIHEARKYLRDLRFECRIAGELRRDEHDPVPLGWGLPCLGKILGLIAGAVQQKQHRQRAVRRVRRDIDDILHITLVATNCMVTEIAGVGGRGYCEHGGEKNHAANQAFKHNSRLPTKYIREYSRRAMWPTV